MLRIEANAGGYDQRVTVYKQSTSPTINPDGQPIETEEEVITRWAKVMPVGGSESFRDEQIEADVTHRVRMRSDSGTQTITPEMWLTLSDGTRLNIKRVLDVDVRKVELELECNQRH